MFLPGAGGGPGSGEGAFLCRQDRSSDGSKSKADGRSASKRGVSSVGLLRQLSAVSGYEDLEQYCLTRNFLIRDCSNFPGLSRGFFRICVRSQEENQRLLKVLQERKQGQILETERLYLRKMEDADFPDLCRMLQDPQVMYAYEHAFGEEEAWEWLRKQQKRYREDGFGLWAVTEKKSGRMIGQCGLTVQECNGRRMVEVGYLFLKAYWHQGYAREAARACRDYAFSCLQVKEVCSMIRDTNLPSQKVAIANGMKVRERLVKHYYGMICRISYIPLQRRSGNG